MAFELVLNDEAELINMPHFVRENGHALAVDAFIAFSRQVQKSATVISELLLAFSTKREIFDNYLVIGEIWSIITASRNMYCLFPLMRIRYGDKTTLIKESLEELYISLNNIDYLLADYNKIPLNGGPVLGNFSWQYRVALDQPTQDFYCLAGTCLSADLGDINSPSSQTKLSPTDGYTGIFNLKFIFNKYIPDNDLGDGHSFKKIELNLSDMIEIFNEIIERINNGISLLKTQALRSNPETIFRGIRLAPQIMHIRPA